MAELRRLSFALVVLCLAEFVLGMLLNLFVSIPQHHLGTSGSDYFLRAVQSLHWGLSHGNLLAAHAGLGLPIFLVSLRLVQVTFQQPSKGLRWVALLGLLAVVAAGFNGASFLSYHRELNSMLMSSSFALAVLCFCSVIYSFPPVTRWNRCRSTSAIWRISPSGRTCPKEAPTGAPSAPV